MASRNRLMGMGYKTPRNNLHEIEEKPEWRGCVYHAITGEPKDFYDLDERNAAIASGEYVDNPSLAGKHNAKDYQDLIVEEMVIAGIPFEDEKFEKEVKETINYAETLDLYQPPPVKKKKKYLSTMNVKELFAEGLKWGLDFAIQDPVPIKLDMAHQIKLAMRDQIGKPLR